MLPKILASEEKAAMTTVCSSSVYEAQCMLHLESFLGVCWGGGWGGGALIVKQRLFSRVVLVQMYLSILRCFVLILHQHLIVLFLCLFSRVCAGYPRRWHKVWARCVWRVEESCRGIWCDRKARAFLEYGHPCSAAIQVHAVFLQGHQQETTVSLKVHKISSHCLMKLVCEGRWLKNNFYCVVGLFIYK